MRQVGFLLYYSIESSTLMGNSAFFANGFISQIVLLYCISFSCRQMAALLIFSFGAWWLPFKHRVRYKVLKLQCWGSGSKIFSSEFDPMIKI